MKKLVLTISIAFLSSNSLSQDFYPMVLEIQNRLDKSLDFYQKGEKEEAKNTIKSAYFEIFENLEGAIRTNISAKKNYQLEKSFWTIHDLISQNGEDNKISENINLLKKDLDEVLPLLKSNLKAQKTHNTENNQNIEKKWQESFKIIDDNLALAINNYQNKNFKEVINLIQTAQYQGFKNSELETTIRLNKSAKEAGKINQYFYNLIALAKFENQLKEFSYLSTILLQDLEELLINLPVKEGRKIIKKDEKKDWEEIKNNLYKKLELSLDFYKQNNKGASIFNLEGAYFDDYQDSGLEERIYHLDKNRKMKIDELFQSLNEAIKKGNSLDIENKFKELKSLLNF